MHYRAKGSSKLKDLRVKYVRLQARRKYINLTSDTDETTLPDILSGAGDETIEAHLKDSEEIRNDEIRELDGLTRIRNVGKYSGALKKYEIDDGRGLNRKKLQKEIHGLENFVKHYRETLMEPFNAAQQI